MKTTLSCFVLLLISPAFAVAQDPALRAQAVQLLERANGLSMSPQLPDLERTDVFHVLDTSSPVREGTFTRVVLQGVGRREETIYGDFHVVDVWTKNGLISTRKSEMFPLDVQRVLRITPISLVRFDDSDVIRAIVERAGAQGLKLRCIEFNTVRGQKIDDNEICVNAADGTLVSENLANELIEYSDFFPFAGEFVPAKIAYSLNGVRKLEITQTVAELKDSTDNVLAAPPNSVERLYCKTYRRAIGQSMPQPKTGYGGRDIDVAVRGVIQTDGSVAEALVDNTDRPELASEALALVKQWRFSPALCDGRVNQEVATFIVHFHGR